MTLNLINHIKLHRLDINNLLLQKQNIKDFYLLTYMKYPNNYFSSEPEQLIAEKVNIPESLDGLLKVAKNTTSIYYLTGGHSKYNTLLKIYNPEIDSFNYTELREFLTDFFLDIKQNTAHKLQTKVREFITEFKNSDELSDYMININLQMYHKLSDNYLALSTLVNQIKAMSEKELDSIIEDIVSIDHFKLNATLYNDTNQKKIINAFNELIYSPKEIEIDINITPTKTVRIYEQDKFLGEYKYLYAFKFIKNKLDSKAFKSKGPNVNVEKIAKEYTQYMLEEHEELKVNTAMQHLLNTNTILEYMEDSNITNVSAENITLSEDAQNFLDNMARNKKL